MQGARIDRADKVIVALRNQVRACYQQRLEQAPTAEGNYTFRLEVGVSGQVTDVQFQPQGSLGAETDACVRQALQSTLFSPPEGPKAVLSGSFELKPEPPKGGP